MRDTWQQIEAQRDAVRQQIERMVREQGRTRGHRRFLRAKFNVEFAEALAAETKAKPKPERKLCGAKTRRNTACIRKALANGRCPNHGGMSTGPKTEAGRQRIAEAQRQRWATWRETQASKTHAHAAVPSA